MPAVLLLCAACAATPPDPRFPALDLPRTGTIGWHARDLPPPVAIVNVRRDGRVSLDGAEVAWPGLTARLWPIADAARNPDHPNRPSLVHLVLRCDRDVPWSAVQKVMQAAGDPAVRMNRFLFGVLPETGADEGTLALYLPLDGGCGDPTGQTPYDAVPVRLILHDGPAPTPADLAAAITAIGAVRFVNLGAAAPVPLGEVLAAADALFRAGVTRVTLVGFGPPDRASALPKIAAPTSQVLTLISGRPAPHTGSASLPPATRVAGLAGCAETYEVIDSAPRLDATVEDPEAPFEGPIIEDARKADPNHPPREQALPPK